MGQSLSLFLHVLTKWSEDVSLFLEWYLFAHNLYENR